MVSSHALTHMYNHLTSFFYPVIMTEFGLNYSQIGLLTASYSFTMGFLQMAAGLLSRFVLRKVLLVIGVIWQALMNVLTGLAASFDQLIASRLLVGAGASPQHPIGNSMLAECSPNKRGRVMGINLIGANSGDILAPIVATLIIGAIGWRFSIILFSIPGLIIGAALLVFVKEIREIPTQSEGPKVTQPFGKVFIHIVKNRTVMGLLLYQMILAFSFGFESFLAAYFVRGLGVEVTTAGFLISINAIGSVVSPIMHGSISDKVGRKPVVLIITGTSVPLLYFLPLTKNMSSLIVILFLTGMTIGRGGAGAAVQAHLADATEPYFRDIAFGLFFTLGFGLGSLGSILYGYFVDAFGFNVAFTYIAVLKALSLIPIIFISEKRNNIS